MAGSGCSGFMLRPSRTVVTSFTPRRTVASEQQQQQQQQQWHHSSEYEEGDWVLSLAASSSTELPATVSCALSNGEVQVYDGQRLHLLSSYNVSSSEAAHRHTTLFKDLVYGPDGSTLVAAGQDGSLVVFDIRQKQPALKSATLSGAALETVSVGFGGSLAAAGSSKGKIHFFDLRNRGSVLGTYGDSHTEHVSQVVFASETSPLLLSGAEDGLVCCFDTSQPTEELALKSVMNIGAPLRRVGFCGDGKGENVPTSVFCLTGSETASLWNWETAHCLQNFSGFQLRQELTQSMAATQTVPFSVQYLIDAHWDEADGEMVLATGNAEGDGALFRLSNDIPDRWKPSQFLKGGHRGVIRAWCPLSSAVSLSAGEDARLVEWHRGLHYVTSPPTNLLHKDTMNVGHHMERSGCEQVAPPPAPGVRAGGPLRRQPQKRHKVASSPY